jgi:hypothetical protein
MGLDSPGENACALSPPPKKTKSRSGTTPANSAIGPPSHDERQRGQVYILDSSGSSTEVVCQESRRDPRFTLYIQFIEECACFNIK